jgi:pilus assembly protein CpaE
MTIIADPDPSRLTELRSAVGASSATVAGVDAVRDTLEASNDHDVVVLGPTIDSGSAFRLAGDYRVTRPTLSIILVRSRIETSVLAEAMRHGVREVVEERDLPGLNQAVERALRLATELRMVGDSGASVEGRKRGTVITVFSAKGGCGKTTLATNLAALLATERHESVCLIDLDLAFGDVGIALQLVPARTVSDAIAMGATLDAEGLRALLTPHSSGLQVLAAPLGPDSKEHVKPDLVFRIIDLLAASFDVVIVDTPPAFDDTTLAAFDRTDALLVLTTPDIPAVKNLRLSLETLHLINFPPEHIKVVLNRADSKVGLSANDVQKSVKLPISAKVPSSRDVPSSVNRGVALTIDNPKHPVSQAIRGIADSIMPATSTTSTGEASPSTSTGGSRKRGLFRPKGE